MSIEYVRAVFQLPTPTGSARMLLLNLAERANDQGLTWPGNELLAKETRLSERQVQRLIPELETAGLIATVRPGNGKGNPRVLRLLFPPADLTQRVTNDAPKGDISAAKDDIICHPLDGQRVTNEDQRVTNGAPKGDTLPEKTTFNPMNPNYNPTATTGRVDLDPVIAAPTPPPPTPARPAVVTQTPRTPRTPKLHTLARPAVTVQSPYLRDPRKFKTGYIPAGQGTNPVEVYYERFSIRNEKERLKPLLEDDLARACPDLERLRPVIVAYSLNQDYRPANVQLIIDWYNRGIPTRGGKAPERKQQNELEYDFSSYQPQLISNGTSSPGR